jgi:glycosyltransferase involved in cell wall biosynthesis
VSGLKIAHLIPYDGIGGVEIAASSMPCGQYPRFEFQRDFIFPDTHSSAPRGSTFNPIPFLGSIRRYLDNDVDILVVSLWRAALVGLCAKILRPSLKLVVFIHNSRDAHFVDYLVTRIAVRWAYKVWSDSEASWKNRLSPHLLPKPRIISFVARKMEPLPDASLAPEFVFWGRLSTQKDLPRALQIFAGVYRRYQHARYHIIGPDGGQLEEIQRECKSLGVSEAVMFYGPQDFAGIRRIATAKCFYLQTSAYEGMAMSVVEAMQMGLVPVVTPAGEIRTYCRHNQNSILVHENEQAVSDIVRVIESEDGFSALKTAAIAHWANEKLYCESIVEASNELVDELSNS